VGHYFGQAEPLNQLLANLAQLSNWAALSGSEPAKPVKNSMQSPTLFHRLYTLPLRFPDILFVIHTLLQSLISLFHHYIVIGVFLYPKK
jgi:hypothetical protein